MEESTFGHRASGSRLGHWGLVGAFPVPWCSDLFLLLCLDIIIQFRQLIVNALLIEILGFLLARGKSRLLLISRRSKSR